MGIRKPFKAVPIRPGQRYQRKTAVTHRNHAAKIWIGAALVGATLGLGSAVVNPADVSGVLVALKPLAVDVGMMRARAPQVGDYWRRCDEARAAGSAPLYAGEPGFRDSLDGDEDGIACEPYPGM